MRKIEGLQVLRGLAAMAVLGFHASEVADLHNLRLWGHAFVAGGSGVDVFFVISGFIVYLVTDRTNTSPMDFARKRFARIYPPYWAVLTVLLLLRAVQGDAPLSAGLAVQNYMLWPLQDYALVPAWSLSLEMAFYALFLLFFFRSKRLFLLALAVWTTVTAVAMPLLNIEPPAAAGFLLHSMVAEFLFGVIVALLYIGDKRLAPRFWLVLGFVLTAVSWWIFNTQGEPPFRELLFGLPAAMIVYGLAWEVRPFPRGAMLIGDASYTLYLIHPIAIALFMELARRTGLWATMNTQIGWLLVCVAVVAASVPLHLWLERPLTRWFNRVLSGAGSRR